MILSLFAYKLADPNCIFLNRGNHESKNLTKMYGFEGEVLAKYDSPTYALFTHVFNYLPLGHIINKKVLVVHGGLFEKDGVKIEDL